MEEIEEEELMLIYEWIDSIPLSKQKKKYSKRFFRWSIISRSNKILYT